MSVFKDLEVDKFTGVIINNTIVITSTNKSNYYFSDASSAGGAGLKVPRNTDVVILDTNPGNIYKIQCTNGKFWNGKKITLMYPYVSGGFSTGNIRGRDVNYTKVDGSINMYNGSIDSGYYQFSSLMYWNGEWYSLHYNPAV